MSGLPMEEAFASWATAMLTRERPDMTAEPVIPRAKARTMNVRRSILPSRSWSTRFSKREFILSSSMHHTGSIAGYHACYRYGESCATTQCDRRLATHALPGPNLGPRYRMLREHIPAVGACQFAARTNGG